MTGDKEENKCKFIIDEKTCHREREPNSEICICHLEDEGKDPKKFWDEVDKILNDRDAEYFDFNRFFFIPRKGENEIDFMGITFSKNADFRDATFSKNAYFWSATFSEYAGFEGATFSEYANFRGATFSEYANFRGATFSEYAGFEWATFSEYAGFKGATFSEYAGFKGATFSRDVDFRDATFSKDAVFKGATFSKDAVFEGATFSGDVDFRGATFSKNAYFWSATFSKNADFRYATFSKNAYFHYVKFSKIADFTEGAFIEKGDFGHVTFSGHTRLRKTLFSSAKFDNATFSDRADFFCTDFFEHASFRGVAFDMPEKVKFHKTDLTHASFLYTDVRRLNFLDPEWHVKKGGSFERRAVYDEEESSDYPAIESLCRQLKYNYEESRNYPIAGDFYIGEMEMRRKKGAPMLHLYKILSMYGENYWLPSAWILFVVIFFGAIFLLLGFDYDGTTIDYSIGWNNPFSISILHDFLLSCIYVFRAITLQSVSISPVEGSIVREFVQAILKPIGVVLFTLWALALRRRFRR